MVPAFKGLTEFSIKKVEMTRTQGRKDRKGLMCKFNLESDCCWLRKLAKASWRKSQTLTAINSGI